MPYIVSARREHLSYDAYNEGAMLQNALEAYKYRNGYYPKRVLLDQIYRTKDNLDFCKKHEIRISGPKLGRPSSNVKTNKKIAKEMHQDKGDRIEFERYFSVAKRRNVMGLIFQKRKDLHFPQ